MPHQDPLFLHPDERLGRRAFLRHLIIGGALVTGAPGLAQLLAACRQEAGPRRIAKAELILRNSRPLDLETPVSFFDQYLTPNEAFFVRTHHDEPRVETDKWRLRIEGLVERPLSLSLDDLKVFQKVSVTAVLQCSGNGRALYSPHVPGAQWERGAVGNARWTGVRLLDVLKQAGVRPNGKNLVIHGADEPVIAKAARFTRNLPIEKAVHPDTILAYEMNDEPLPYLHGHPVRLVTPGWVGDDWVKWITQITVQEEEYDGFFFATAYRYPTRPVKPGENIPHEQMSPMTEMPVKSLFATPSDGARLQRGAVALQGVAWSGGEALITKVEISADGGKSWMNAELFGEERPYAWRQWRAQWTPGASGRFTLMARATDSRGQTQPVEASPWNPGGYLWNACDRIAVTIA